MSLLSFAQWVQSTDFFTAFRLSAYVYPIVLSLHLMGIALFGGTILITDLRLLGVAMRSWPVSDVVGQLRGLKHLGLLLVVTCGLLLLGSKAEEYYYNPFFRMKVCCLALIVVHGLIFRRNVYKNTAALDKAPQMPARAKLAASLSLILWICVVVAGRSIGYVEPPLKKLHASAKPYLNTELSSSARR